MTGQEGENRDRIKRNEKGEPLPDHRMLALCIHLEVDCPYRIRRECTVCYYGGRELKAAGKCKLEDDLRGNAAKLTRQDCERILDAMPYSWIEEYMAERKAAVEDWMKTERGW